jgi:hypothetical protein
VTTEVASALPSVSNSAVLPRLMKLRRALKNR